VNSEAAAAAQQPFVSACINKSKFMAAMAAAAPIEAIGCCCTFAARHTSQQHQACKTTREHVDSIFSLSHQIRIDWANQTPE